MAVIVMANGYNAIGIDAKMKILLCTDDDEKIF